MPEVVEYVQEKADLYELQKTVKSWERKVEIAEVRIKVPRGCWGGGWYSRLCLGRGLLLPPPNLYLCLKHKDSFGKSENLSKKFSLKF